MKVPIRIVVTDISNLPAGIGWEDILYNWDEVSNFWNEDITIPFALDLYENESIQVKKVVKEKQDFATLFTDYSKSFTVPATKTNNRVLKHFHNIDIVDGLDIRQMLPCVILMNNEIYQVGNLSVESVRMSGGKPDSYTLRFYGKMTELKKLIGQDKLKDLALNITLTDYNPIGQFQSALADDLVFPLASRQRRLKYHSGTKTPYAGDDYKNLAYIDSTRADNYGFSGDEQVGALKVGRILDEIENAYGITFNGSLTENYVRDLYLWLSKIDKDRTTSLYGEYASSLSPTTTSHPNATVWEGIYIVNNTPINRPFRVRARTSKGKVTVRLFSGYGNTYVVEENTNSYSDWLQLDYGFGQFDFLVEDSTGGDANLFIDVEYWDGFSWNTENFTDVVTLITSTQYKVLDRLPDMKVADFLSTLFKMFNLVAEMDGELNITTKPYDVFMSTGEEFDACPYVTVDDYDVLRPNVYSAADFKFSDPKTALEVGYTTVNSKNYGQLIYELVGEDNKKLEGELYEVKLDTQRMPLEPLTNESTSTLTPIVHAYFADTSFKEQEVKPAFTYIAYTGNDSAYAIAYDTGTTVTSVQSYFMPSNVYANNQIPTKDNALVGLYFDEELNEHGTAEQLTGLSLWSLFYRGSTAIAFDEYKRSVNFKAYFTTKALRDLSLADVLEVRNNRYIINSLTINYATGVTDIDCTLVGYSRLPEFTPYESTVTNTSATEVLRVVYLNHAGEVTSTNIYSGQSPTIQHVGSIRYFSHNDYTVA